MYLSETRAEAIALVRPIAAAARTTGWRLCPHCAELSVPPGGGPLDCFACVAIVPANPHKDRSHDPRN